MSLAKPKLLDDVESYNETTKLRIGSNATLACPFKNFDHFEWFKDELEMIPLNEQMLNISFENISPTYEGISEQKAKALSLFERTFLFWSFVHTRVRSIHTQRWGEHLRAGEIKIKILRLYDFASYKFCTQI